MLPSPMEVDAFVAQEYPWSYATGHRCVEMAEGRARARWRYDPATLRPGGLISGPTQFQLADLSLWFLSFTVLGLSPMAVTSDLHISFLRPAAGGDLIAEAILLRAGKTRIVGDVRVWVEGKEEKIVAHAVGAYQRLK